MAAAKATADKIAAATHDATASAAVTANVPAKTSEDGTATAPSVTDNADTKGLELPAPPCMPTGSTAPTATPMT